jgi:hypothetical protein
MADLTGAWSFLPAQAAWPVTNLMPQVPTGPTPVSCLQPLTAPSLHGPLLTSNAGSQLRAMQVSVAKDNGMVPQCQTA